MERFRTCAFYNIIREGVPNQKKDVIERMCQPYCKENCPVLPTLEFTGDSVVPYIEKGEEIDPPIVDLSAFDKYIEEVYKKR